MSFQPNTSIYLVSIPEFQIGNANEMLFKSKEEQYNFFYENIVDSYDEQSYTRVSSGSVKVQANYDTLVMRCPNWLMFKNKNYSDKWYYANVVNVYYLTPNTTEIQFSLDSFQTFMFDIDFSLQNYISRRTWFKNDDTKELMNLPYEDLDIGTTYINCDKVYDFNSSELSFEDRQMYYILMTEPLFTSSHEIVTGSKTMQYLKNNETVTITTQNGISTVLYGYLMNYKYFSQALEKGLFSKDCKYVNSLQLCILLPFGLDMITNYTNKATQMPSPYNTLSGVVIDQSDVASPSQEIELDGWCGLLNNYINNVIEKLDEEHYESDTTFTSSAIGRYLYRYPYSLLEVYDYNNQPQNINLDDLNRYVGLDYCKNNVLPIQKYGSIGQTPTLVYQIKGYKNSGYKEQQNNLLSLGGLYSITSQNMFTINSLITLPIISDYLSAFLQSNQNQINAQKKNLVDSLSTQITNANASTQASINSINASRQNAEIGASTTALNSRLNNETSLANQLAGARTQYSNQQASNYMNFAGAGITGAAMVATGNVGGGLLTAGTGLANAYVNQMQAENVYNTTVNNANRTANTSNQINANSYSSAMAIARNASSAAYGEAITNRANTLRSANNYYQNSIRSLNARLNDIANVPNTVQSMGSNASIFNVLNDRDVIMFTTKTLPYQILSRLCDYFTRYGFLTNQSDTISNIFNKKDEANSPGVYIQTVNCLLKGQIPSENLTEIKNMFDNGVMLWDYDKYLKIEEMRNV